MRFSLRLTHGYFLALLSLSSIAGCHPHATFSWLLLPEQRELPWRDPAELPKARIPDLPAPATVSEPIKDEPEQFLSLDAAIRIALERADVVRVLAGATAVNSGSTIYDPAITNATIDQEQGRFDPRLEWLNSVDRIERPGGVGVLSPLIPSGAYVGGIRTDGYNGSINVEQTNVTGGTAGLRITDNFLNESPRVSALDPENRHAVEMSYVQPLLQGGGIAPNVAPIVIARINTERSFFQLKASFQDSIRGVIEAYWNLVFARTDAWARRQQVEQGQAALERAEARRRQGFGTAAEVAQARLALANFKALQVGADANVLQREAALRNILGLPPTGTPKLVPVTAPSTANIRPKWDELIRLAEERRPDLVELKLILEADQQRLIQRENQALPRLDFNALYRWNGLEGVTPTGTVLSTQGGEFTDWSVGVNFSVPLGLRRERAAVREQVLILARDRANLDQGLHAAVHDLATSVRSLSQNHEQFQAYREARIAARINFDQQMASFVAGRTIFLNVLQAITDWGNSVSSEAQALAQYNTELANLERETGTILETHGIFFFEERTQFVGPLGKHHPYPHYPNSIRPGENAPRYPEGKEPAENFFHLQPPEKRPAPETAPPVPVP